MTKQILANEKKLDVSLTLHAVRWDDVNAVAQLSYDLCEAKGDTSVAFTPEALANEWKYEGFNPEQDAFIIETDNQQIVGFAALFNVKDHCELSGDLYVHPKFKRLGIETTLLRAMNTRAGEYLQIAAADSRVFIRITDHKDEAGESILAREGYSPIRHQ